MGTHYLNADQLLAEWALDRFACEPGTLLVSVTFGHYVSCYSSYTCDYGVTGTFTFCRPDGTTYDKTSEYGFPDVIESMASYRAEQEMLEEEHAKRHGREKGR